MRHNLEEYSMHLQLRENLRSDQKYFVHVSYEYLNIPFEPRRTSRWSSSFCVDLNATLATSVPHRQHHNALHFLLLCSW
jgi:hypothetical protein